MRAAPLSSQETRSPTKHKTRHNYVNQDKRQGRLNSVQRKVWHWPHKDIGGQLFGTVEFGTERSTRHPPLAWGTRMLQVRKVPGALIRSWGFALQRIRLQNHVTTKKAGDLACISVLWIPVSLPTDQKIPSNHQQTPELSIVMYSKISQQKVWVEYRYLKFKSTT